MPYTTENPPEKISQLPEKAQHIWVKAFNNAWENYDEVDTDKDKEAYAHSVAWSAVEQKYKKKDGQWVRKMITPSDVSGLMEEGRIIPMPGKIVVEPHGKLIREGEKTAVVSAKHWTKYIGRPVYLIQDEKAYGIIEMKEGKKINLEEFKDLRNQHQVSGEERREWWPDKKELYFFPVEVISKFEPAKPIARPQDAQTWISPVTFKKLDLTPPKELSDKELMEKHRKMHKIWDEVGTPAENIMNYHILLVDEMERRDIEHPEMPGTLDKKSKEFRESYEEKGVILNLNEDINLIEKQKDYARVKGSGKKMGEPISQDDVLDALDNFRVQVPFIHLTGGVANRGQTEGDVDILLPSWMSKEFRRIVEFRISRQLPEWIASRVHFVYDRYGSPFTDAIPLYNLEMPLSEKGPIKMSEDEKDVLQAEPEVEEAIEPAYQSAEEDEIELFRYFLPLKPTQGYHDDEWQTIENFLDVVEDMGEYPIYSSKKADGANIEIHRKADKVKIYSEDGTEITDRLPTVVEKAKQLGADKFVFTAEAEYWKKDKHQPREVVAGYLHEKNTEPDDSPIIINVYDCPYWKEDIHNKPFTERLEVLRDIDFPQSATSPDTKYCFNLLPHTKQENREELKEKTKELREIEESEGNVCVVHNAEYRLDGKRSGMIKYHNAFKCNGIVLDSKETKTEGVWNYTYGIQMDKDKGKTVEMDGETYHKIGKTFNTDTNFDKGDGIVIEGETLNFEKHSEKGINITIWVPRVMGKGDTVDSVDELVDRAKERSCYQEKVFKDGETFYKIKDYKNYKPSELSDKVLLDDHRIVHAWFSSIKSGKTLRHDDGNRITLEECRKFHSQIVDEMKKRDMEHDSPLEKNLQKDNPYMEYPKEEKKYDYTVQRHWRGKSAHCDLRIVHNDYLLGWTIADQIEGEITDPVTTMDEAKTEDEKDQWKMDWDKGVPKMRPPQEKGEERQYAELTAIRKAREPKEWLNVEGKVPKGEVGATSDFPGVFQIIDKGKCQYGSQKSYWHEYFFTGGKLQGRWGFRQLDPEQFGKSLKDMIEKFLEKEKIESIYIPKSDGELVKFEKDNEVIPPSKETEYREEAAWFLMKPEDETPYTLSMDGAVDSEWVPPKGVSAIPEFYRGKIPEDYQYWKEDSEDKRLEVRDEFVKENEEKIEGWVDEWTKENTSLEKSLNDSELWAKSVYRYILSQQQYTIWIKLEEKEKKERVSKLLDKYIEENPIEKINIDTAVNYLERRPNEIKNLIADELESEFKKNKDVDFILHRHWWRGQHVVRAGASRERWDLYFDFPDEKGLMFYILEQNPTENESVTAALQDNASEDWKEFEGYLPPENERKEMTKEELDKLPPDVDKANQTKATSSYTEIIDKGTAQVYENSAGFKKFEFKNDKLTGLWIIKREDPQSSFWIMKKEEKAPETE